MHIEPIYTDRNTTPLAFFTFLKVLICISILGDIIGILGSFFHILSLLGSIITLGMHILVAYGYFKWKWWAVLLYWASIAFSLLCNLVNLFTAQITIGSFLLSAGCNVLLFGLTYIYFQKRKLLFEL